MFRLFFFLLLIASAHASDDLKAFPPAENGMVRHVLILPKELDETLHKVELIAGKTILIDKQNSYFFAGSITSETVMGWGYTKYVVSNPGPLGGTLMAVDPDEPKVKRFIKYRGSPYIIPYNSRLPVVVYAPESVEVHYRIWSTELMSKKMEEG